MIHMVTIFRRHLKACEHKDKGRSYRRCKCPIYAAGTLSGKPIKQSMKTGNWQRAAEIVHQWETTGAAIDTTPVEQPTISDACTQFKDDAIARGLSPATLKKYRVLLDQFQAFCLDAGPRYLSQLSIKDVRKFRQSWADGNISATKKLERLKSLFRFFELNGWCEDLAKSLKSPIVDDIPTLPFTREEMEKIMRAAPSLPTKHERIRNEFSALILLLRYSGLRIGDAVQLHEDRLKENRLLLYMAKTRVPVYVPLPDFVVHRLEFVRRPNGHFFCSGKAKTDSYTSNWRLRFKKLFYLARVEGGHPQRFRDTFAVELLLAGVPLDQVSKLLGHQSTKITEKHYAPWVRSRQQQLDASVTMANANETNGSYQDHVRMQ